MSAAGAEQTKGGTQCPPLPRISCLNQPKTEHKQNAEQRTLARLVMVQLWEVLGKTQLALANPPPSNAGLDLGQFTARCGPAFAQLMVSLLTLPTFKLNP